ncbi:hypothetical protein LIER_28868 [Lithospermum erythrorhizon]|uniref:BZIP domain-containing protein n=1 Tax=Lithospermum erythrorhizon TaxID=34254 RepID=A0AAV3RH66_LITER
MIVVPLSVSKLLITWNNRNNGSHNLWRELCHCFIYYFIMGHSEDGMSCKAEKSSPPVEQTNVHVYPDWATMQAYYGPQVAVPPYFNPAVASGHPLHHYMWGPPQSMMSPYGTPYAVYPHGGVYAHPGVTLANASLGMDTPTKSSTNSDQRLVKKLNEFDGLAMSTGNGNANSADGGANQGILQSSGETEDSSGGSNESSAEADQKNKKRSREGSRSNGEDGKGNPKIEPPVVKEVCGSDARMLMGSPADAGNKNSTDMSISLYLKTPTTANPNSNIIKNQGVPAVPLLQNERELKREKRKQSNRESARRSRLRKQAEAEELAIKVQLLTAENMTLKSEINKFVENSKKLKLENTAIMDKLHNSRAHGTNDESNEEKERYENKRSEAKLYPLLGTSSRTDAVAAG